MINLSFFGRSSQKSLRERKGVRKRERSLPMESSWGLGERQKWKRKRWSRNIRRVLYHLIQKPERGTKISGVFGTSLLPLSFFCQFSSQFPYTQQLSAYIKRFPTSQVFKSIFSSLNACSLCTNIGQLCCSTFCCFDQPDWETRLENTLRCVWGA